MAPSQPGEQAEGSQQREGKVSGAAEELTVTQQDRSCTRCDGAVTWTWL